jgi:hypothetical protein
MIRVIVYLALAIGLVYLATSVQFGKHTLVGHFRAIWHTSEVQDLKDGVKEKAQPTVDKLERGAKDSYHSVSNDLHGSDAGSATATAKQ